MPRSLTGSGGMGAMGGAEGVVDVDIGELGEFLAEGVVVGFFFVIIAEVFEQGDFAILEFRGGFLGDFADAIGDELDRDADEDGEGRDYRGEALLGVALALGTAQVRAEEDARAVLDQVVDRRDGFLDALVVGDDLDAVLFLEGHVVIDTDEDAFALEFKVADGDFGHKIPNF
jgi:hypothetical protein